MAKTGGGGSGRSASLSTGDIRKGDMLFVPGNAPVIVTGRTRGGDFRARTAGTDWAGRRQSGVIRRARVVGGRVARGDRYFNIR